VIFDKKAGEKSSSYENDINVFSFHLFEISKTGLTLSWDCWTFWVDSGGKFSIFWSLMLNRIFSPFWVGTATAAQLCLWASLFWSFWTKNESIQGYLEHRSHGL